MAVFLITFQGRPCVLFAKRAWNQIRQWLRDDRLEVTEDSPMVLTCESCGEPIRSGKYCEKCKSSMSRGFNEVLKTNHPEPAAPKPKTSGENPGAKMRFL